jgi:hypothetical protein
MDNQPESRDGLQDAVLLVTQCLDKFSKDSDESARAALAKAVSQLRSCSSKASWSSTTAQAEDAWSHACALWVRARRRRQRRHQDIETLGHTICCFSGLERPSLSVRKSPAYC